MLGLIYYYFLWHYSQALSDISRHIKNFLWFLYHFFSIPLLAKTLFAPWERLEEHYRGGVHPGEIGTVIAVNLIMRAVGFVIRILVIIFGVLVLIAAFFLGIFWLILWLLSPFILLLLIIASFQLII